MLLKFGSFPIVVGSFLDAAKIFLIKMDLTFALRPKTFSSSRGFDVGGQARETRVKAFTQICGTESSAVTVEWAMSELRLESYEYIRAEEMGSLVKEIFGFSGRAFSVKDSLSTLSLNVICRMVLGRRYMDGGGVAVEEFKEMLDELFLLTGVLNVGDMIPCINFLDLQGYVKRMKVLSEKFDRFLENVLDEHEARRRETTGYASRDMVDVLLELAEDPMLDVKLERHGVKAFTQNIKSRRFVSGWDREFICGSGVGDVGIIEKPEILKKATDELDQVIGKNRWVMEKDIPSLPYVKAVVKETMRLHPVAPMLSPRLAREDYPLLWENPNEFNPDRFIGKDIDVKGQDFELLPFGVGP
ncbi:hypothetical protein SASPL_157531 [Salvia splendens]|uniref:Cytochrome P450 n=1 Tax=Salvia splendens TaxID=180675 RepID=A0A8X8VUV0_SALSN|nr:hypothetical protein SASPL_157531 [Salvia splendens]